MCYYNGREPGRAVLVKEKATDSRGIGDIVCISCLRMRNVFCSEGSQAVRVDLKRQIRNCVIQTMKMLMLGPRLGKSPSQQAAALSLQYCLVQCCHRGSSPRHNSIACTGLWTMSVVHHIMSLPCRSTTEHDRHEHDQPNTPQRPLLESVRGLPK